MPTAVSRSHGWSLSAAACVALTGCQPPAPATNETLAPPRADSRAEGRGGWDLQSSGEGAALALLDERGRTVIRLFCPSSRNELLVNVPSFRPVGSEERLSLGSNGTVVALVANTSGDPLRGGVTATGPQPDELKEILVGGPIRAVYGAQQSGPHPRVADALSGPFVSACSEGAIAERQAAAKPTPSTHPCHVQDGRVVRLSMRALGTEPFWNAAIDGRCVTYSTPENQAGTRLWTKIGDGPDGPIFAGAYQGRPFTLVLRPGTCSDGMSDRRYDWTARLTVNGEERRGCAETLPSGR